DPDAPADPDAVPLGAGSRLLQPPTAPIAPTTASEYQRFLMSMIVSRSTSRIAHGALVRAADFASARESGAPRGDTRATSDRSGVGAERLAKRGGPVQAQPGGVPRDDHEHDDGGQVGRHGEQVTVDRNASRLQVELQHRDAAEEVCAKQDAARSPGGE